jgi:hypothetical protein
VEERWLAVPEGWPSPEELEDLRAAADLTLLPDRLERSGGDTVVAAFREEAQAFRVDALGQGLTVNLVRPPESELAAYREHAADWVLPYILGIPTTVVTGLIVHRLQKWADGRKAGDPAPTVRYREARVIDGETKVRELEGPADEVAALLAQGARDELSAVDPEPNGNE